MSGKFSGFSEDDIKQVQNGRTAPRNLQPSTDKQTAQTSNKKSQKVIIRVDKARHKVLESKVAANGGVTPLEAKLSLPIKPVEVSPKNTNEKESEQLVNNVIQQEQPDKQNKMHDDNQHNLEKSDVSNDLNEKRSIESFEERQKVIEEQNKRRKELLSKALADRTKRTQEEAQKLNDIQNEFKKLDDSLSNDVKILRKKIEHASFDYMVAQKRYLRIEKAFLEAKVQLQNKLDKKELLTEHLCTIIECNEERKAEKLTELLNKLDLESVKPNCDVAKSANLD